MKQLLFFAIFVGLALTACRHDTAPAEQVQTATSVAPDTTLAVLVEQARQQGASWTTEQWKEQFKQALLAYKPYAQAETALMQQIDTAQHLNTSAQEAIARVQALEQQYPGYDKLIGQFIDIAATSPAGQALINDPDYLKDLMKQLDIPMP